MLVLSAAGVSKAYGVKTILDQIDCSIQQGERVGVVGPNGAGKTTLLSILAGALPADSGQFYRPPGTSLGYLRQQTDLTSPRTVYDEMLQIFAPLLAMERELAALSQAIAESAGQSDDHAAKLNRYAHLTTEYEHAGGYRFRSDIRGMLTSLAFPEEWYDRPISGLSGGERTRLSLAGLLLTKPDLLLLDEPTNHLDIGTLAWLEQYLKNYPGTILLISHDRYFLDQTVDRIFEIDNHRLTAYTGNYTDFRRQKQERAEIEQHHYQNQIKEYQRQTEMIRRFHQHGTEKLAKRARSRELRLAQLTVPKAPETAQQSLKMRFRELFASGSQVLTAENLSKAFPQAQGARQLFHGLELEIKRGERVCLVGANGIGKTSLLKILTGSLPQDDGEVILGHNVRIGYYDQEQRSLTNAMTVMEELHQEYRLYSETEIRSWLGRFLFVQDDVFKKVADLSGGEKARLALLKLMLAGANFLILDEPTNHLDLSARDVFESALADYPGTLLVVSHDRYFLNRVATRILELTENGLVSYAGGYDYYMEKRQSLDSGRDYLRDLAEQTGSAVPASATADRQAERHRKLSERQRNKAEEAKQRRQAREISALEQAIHEQEFLIAKLEAALTDPEIASDYTALAKYAAELEAAKAQLEQTYAQWFELH